MVFALLLAFTLPASSRATFARISSDRADFDRTEGVALFDGHATIDYGTSARLTANRLLVFFSGTNEFDRAVAIGRVAVSNETRRGSCDSAVFRRKANEIQMFGGADGTPARLEEVGSDALEGRSITFWLDTEQVEVSNAALTIDTKRKGVLKNP